LLLLISVCYLQLPIDSLDDDMDRATTTIVGQPTETKTLRHYALASKRCIPMELYTKYLVAKLTIGGRGFEEAHLLSPGHTHSYRIRRLTSV